MTSPQWDNDESVLAELADAIRATEPSSARTRWLGEGAYAWHGADYEFHLASLLYDSLLDPDPAARAGDGSASRTIVFEGAAGSVELERTGDALIGQVIPPESGAIELVAADGQNVRATVDSLGCFSFENVPGQPVKVRWRTGDAQLCTEWIRL